MSAQPAEHHEDSLAPQRIFRERPDRERANFRDPRRRLSTNMLVVTGHQERYPAAALPRPASAAHAPGAFLRGEPEGAITGRLLEDGTAVVVIQKDQEALAWADYHLAGERLPGVRGATGAGGHGY